MYNIILPTYNERDNIVTLINMIRSYLKYDLLIIIVDDGSTDGTLEEIDKCYGKWIVSKEKDVIEYLIKEGGDIRDSIVDGSIDNDSVDNDDSIVDGGYNDSEVDNSIDSDCVENIDVDNDGEEKDKNIPIESNINKNNFNKKDLINDILIRNDTNKKNLINYISNKNILIEDNIKNKNILIEDNLNNKNIPIEEYNNEKSYTKHINKSTTLNNLNSNKTNINNNTLESPFNNNNTYSTKESPFNNTSSTKSTTTKIKILKRYTKKGLGTAYKHAITHCTNPYTFILDADLSHDPKYLPSFIKTMSLNNYDIIISNRYTKGIYGWSLLRKIISRAANNLACFILNLDYKDLTNSYRLYKTDVLRNILNNICSTGYSVQMELIWNAVIFEYKIGVIDIVFYERFYGVSKFCVGEVLMFIWKLVILFCRYIM